MQATTGVWTAGLQLSPHQLSTVASGKTEMYGCSQLYAYGFLLEALINTVKLVYDNKSAYNKVKKIPPSSLYELQDMTMLIMNLSIELIAIKK